MNVVGGSRRGAYPGPLDVRRVSGWPNSKEGPCGRYTDREWIGNGNAPSGVQVAVWVSRVVEVAGRDHVEWSNLWAIGVHFFARATCLWVRDCFS